MAARRDSNSSPAKPPVENACALESTKLCQPSRVQRAADAAASGCAVPASGTTTSATRSPGPGTAGAAQTLKPSSPPSADHATRLRRREQSRVTQRLPERRHAEVRRRRRARGIGDAERAVADGNRGDQLARPRAHHRDRVGIVAGHEQLALGRVEDELEGVAGHGNARHHLLRGGVDDRDVVAHDVGGVEPAAVGSQRQAVRRRAARRHGGDDGERVRVDDGDGLAALADVGIADVDPFAVAARDHAARPVADRDGGQRRQRRGVDHRQRIGSLVGDVDAGAVGRDGDSDGRVAGLGEADRLLGRGVEDLEPIAVERADVGAFAVGAEGDAVDPVGGSDGAGGRERGAVDGEHGVEARRDADVEAPARRAQRERVGVVAGRHRRQHGIAGGVDDGDAAGELVGDVDAARVSRRCVGRRRRRGGDRARRRPRARGKQCQGREQEASGRHHWQASFW